ncbi:serine protease [Candidatus Laterigemmans baculatus]|uniref:serine protease n=1 Tax=Candidatus Laterigemmans baculatus TaxID=2770505 RepID=UPI0013DD4CBC|nr:serine protease [Candidatus Laterigemmans baculatus]
MKFKIALRLAFSAALLGSVPAVQAQSVCLPSPRLLTTMPMGGQVGTTVEITITGEHLEGAEELRFSNPALVAKPKLDDKGAVVPNVYVVTIGADCPLGIHEARLMTRLGLSSSRVFNVGALPETTRDRSNTSLETAYPIALDSVCNAVMTKQGIDYYRFEAEQGQRVVIDCAAMGIESKLKPVLIVADEKGADLQVERRGGAIDFTAPSSGAYVIKVHDLTYNGGPHYFYRLAIRTAEGDALVPPFPAVQTVSSFSWPPPGLAAAAPLSEAEPNNEQAEAQPITLPCDIAGSFFPAADVDVFEFTAKKGEVWWIEVASERLGLATDPAIVVQHVSGSGAEEKLTDVVELSDIPSPVKVSSNGYSYDGPPYNAGSTDILGKLEIQQDGVHRLQIRDLFGGTRKDPRNIYRLVIRKAAPDFAVVGWALHMNLRNGDRNALSKPVALRGGATMALEVVVVRRDGFDGEIELLMENLPAGVTASGLKIPAGASRGIMLVTAAEDAPRGVSNATFLGRATINGETVTRPGRIASMQWPVPNAWSEIPNPRLLIDVPVSVSGTELAPITVEPAEDKLWEVAAGEKLAIPLSLTRRSEFSGANINFKTYGAGFEGAPAFDVPLGAEISIVNLDLAALKTPPGEYVIAFYGSAVTKYKQNPEAEPQDIADIVVSEPITIRVKPAE